MYVTISRSLAICLGVPSNMRRDDYVNPLGKKFMCGPGYILYVFLLVVTTNLMRLKKKQTCYDNAKIAPKMQMQYINIRININITKVP